MSQDNNYREFNSDKRGKKFVDFSVQAAGYQSEIKITASVTSNVITFVPTTVTPADFSAVKFTICGADPTQTLSANLNLTTPANVVMDFSALTPLKDNFGRSYVRFNFAPYSADELPLTNLGNTAERDLLVGVDLASFVLLDSKRV
jgi:hypothetical protein